MIFLIISLRQMLCNLFEQKNEKSINFSQTGSQDRVEKQRKNGKKKAEKRTIGGKEENRSAIDENGGKMYNKLIIIFWDGGFLVLNMDTQQKSRTSIVVSKEEMMHQWQFLCENRELLLPSYGTYSPCICKNVWLSGKRR